MNAGTIVWNSGNIGENTSADDPLFVNAATGNFRLGCGSPCTNAGEDDDFPPDQYDLDGDFGTSELTPDLDRGNRVLLGAIIDMGCYESHALTNVDQSICPDLNGDCLVNVNDMLAVINNWGQTGVLADLGPSCGGDGEVNVQDLLAVINGWGACDCFQGVADEASFPTSIQDCMDFASQEHQPYSASWNDFLDKCVAGLCEAQLIDCE